MDRTCLLNQIRGDHHLNSLVHGHFILLHVLPPKVRVDRHVSLATSADGWDEIEGYGSTLAAKTLHSLVRDSNLHVLLPRARHSKHIDV